MLSGARASGIIAWLRRLVIASVAAVFLVGLTVSHREPGEAVIPVIKKEVMDNAVVRPLPSGDLATLVRSIASEWTTRKTLDDVPNAAPVKLPGGLDGMDIAEKKTLFFRSVLPHVLTVNKNIRARREWLTSIEENLAKGLPVTPEESDFVARMVKLYRSNDDLVDWDSLTTKGKVDELLMRVDEIPPSLVLAQAAIESAWGSSRFAIEGNNIFGIWVFNATEGMIPREREEGANHKVARFETITESVESYVSHLNTLWAYEDFRAIRAKMRQDEQKLDSTRLAEGLLQYSVRRDEYVQDVLNLIKANRLTRFDSARIESRPDEEKREEVKTSPAYGPIKTKASDA